jgi:hypothetical protein
VYSELHFEALRQPRPTPRVIEGWPPPAKHPPPRTRVRRRAALSLARLARRIDDASAWRAFAP